MNYWIFLYNPKKYRYIDSVISGNPPGWCIRQHNNEIKIGDRAIIWQSKGNAKSKDDLSSCMGLAEITSLPYNNPTPDPFWNDPKMQNQAKAGESVDLKFIKNICNKPIPVAVINHLLFRKGIKEVTKYLRQTNTHSLVTKDQYDTIYTILTTWP